jgi:hypothetical protein
MALLKNSKLILICISAAALSLALLAPYEFINSISLDNHQPNQPNSISKFDFDDDEFTGDAIPALVNTDIAYGHPQLTGNNFK